MSTELLKNTLMDARKEFAVAFNGDKEITNKYILSVLNTVTLNDNLQKCTPESIRDAAITSAVLGVNIDAHQYAYLIPYNGKAQFQMSYKGYINVAKRDKDVDNIWSNVVYEDDAFNIDLGSNIISHIPNLESAKYGLAQHIKYVYAVVRFKVDTHRTQMFEVMTKKQIDEIRAVSKSGGEKDKYGNPTIWARNYSEMARKTVIKRLCKHAQLGDVARFDEIDNGIEQGKIINVTPTGELRIDDALTINKNKILALIEAAKTIEEHEAIYIKYTSDIEELAANNMHSEVNKACKEKKEELYIEKVIECLQGCEDLDSLEKVYTAHQERINTCKASRRNGLLEIYCKLKQVFMEKDAI